MTEPAGLVSTVGVTDDGTTMPRTPLFAAVDDTSSETTYQKSGTGEAQRPDWKRATTTASTERRFMASSIERKGTITAPC
jgi:hypothetical protein